MRADECLTIRKTLVIVYLHVNFLLVLFDFMLQILCSRISLRDVQQLLKVKQLLSQVRYSSLMCGAVLTTGNGRRVCFGVCRV